MKKEKIVKTTKIISMSTATKKKISKVAEEINGRNLFTEKIELAQKTLENLKALPI
ncbi:hypothetical protein SAMN05444397_101800 [Flavobacterium aquidurense]|jgi:ubiquinone biosynthesis protein Coq4|uniref:hypothetical protein n=1 Tax=Flavobacterium frigidimaris TaxID=262320 RepID=UPI00089C8128|nr:hypothetical protein [Flavobacterium frigidimaris]SDY50332.1 hypothetical protein SAMN05444397_101800 [Flavobacterium aquidurense]